MKILLIGNSFTYFNDMPSAVFAPLAETCGDKVEVFSVTKGGCSLSRFADPLDEWGGKVKEMLDGERFDAVVLQEQSHTPISAPDKFYSAVRRLCAEIRKKGATPYLYATWGYHPKKESLELYAEGTEDMEMKLRAAYSAIGEELGVSVCHVGAAMTYAYKNSGMTIYQPDHYHPALCGSIIAAMTIYSRITGKDPASLEVPSLGVTPEDVKSIKEAVFYAADEKNTRIVQGYETSSRGIGV